MFEILLENPNGWLIMALAAIITIAIVAIATVAIVFLRKFLKKLGLNDSDTNALLESAKAIIKTVVLWCNQTIVDNLKSQGDGHLTEEQQKEVYNTVLTQVTNILSSDQLNAILKTYGGEDVEYGLNMLIESAVAESHMTKISIETEESKE